MGPGGELTPGNIDPFKWGGETGMTTGQAWDKFWNKDQYEGMLDPVIVQGIDKRNFNF